MIRQTFKIINKNLKLLLRSRSSALIFVLGPLMLILLVGFAFNSVGTGIVDIGIYSDKYSEVTLSFVKEIADGPFRTLKFKSQQTCVDSIKKGTISACVIFPRDLNIKDTSVDEIKFYVDYSKINIVWQVMDRIKKQLTKATDSFSLDLTNTLIFTLNDINSEANNTYPIIDETNVQNDYLIKKIGENSVDLNLIDLSLDDSSYNFENIKLEVGTLKHKIAIMYNNLDNMYKKSKSLTDLGLSNALRCTSGEDEEDALRESMDFSQISVFKSDIDQAYSESLSKLNYSFSEIEDLEEMISDLKLRLDIGESKRSEIQDNLSKTAEIVLVNKQNVNLMKNKIDNVVDLVASIEVKNAENIVKPVSTNIKPVVPEKTNLMYLFPNLLTLIMLFMCILLAATIVVNEKKSTAYFRNFISPTTDLNFVFGSYFTNIFLMVLQLGLILLIANYYFNTSIFLGLWNLLLVMFLLISLFTFIGMFVGFLLNSQDTVTIGAIIVSSIMLFLSDMIMPLETMPTYILKLAKYNPFIIGSDLLKKVILFNAPFSEISSSVFLLIFYFLLAFFAVLLMQYLIKKQKIAKFANLYVMKRERKKARKIIKFEGF